MFSLFLLWGVKLVECHCIWKVISVCSLCIILWPICPEWQLSFIWETVPLLSISVCLCSDLFVSPSHRLGCIIWLMSSGQSAIGTRTCSGNPEADWHLANGEDTMTSGGVSCQTSSYASGHMPAVGTSLPLPVCRLDTQNRSYSWAYTWAFVPSGFSVSCLSAICANITTGGSSLLFIGAWNIHF